MNTDKPQDVGTSIYDRLPSHPLVGKCLRFKHGEWRGGSYYVRKPDGTELWMRCGDFEKAVSRVTPKNVHLGYPTLKVGDLVSGSAKLLNKEREKELSYSGSFPCAALRIASITQKELIALDAYFNENVVVTDVHGPVREQVFKCTQLQRQNNPEALLAAAKELYWDELDEVFGAGNAPCGGAPKPDLNTHSITPATVDSVIDNLEKDLTSRPGKVAQGPDI